MRIRRYSARLAPIVALCCAAASLGLASCSAKEGWGVVLWPPEGSALAFGGVVPVHFKSSITKTYAVGVPGSDAKEELELWRVELHRSRSKAKSAAEALGDRADLLGVSTRDGLVIRTEPENGADQVYRLRLGQDVRLLRTVKGAAVETGGKPLPGDWYLALADDGTRGYVFSNQLALYRAATEPRPEIAKDEPDTAASLSALFDTVWRPDYFDAMTVSGLFDLAAYQPRYGIFTDAQRRVIRVEHPGYSRVYRYETIVARDDGSFAVVPGGASFHFTKAGTLVLTPPESDIAPEALERARAERGPDAVVSYEFVRHVQDVKEVVAAEERRRLSRLADFVAEGERYESESGGVLIITRSGRFTWIAYGALSPDPIPEGSGETGSIAMDLYLSPELRLAWDGAFSIRFDGPKRPSLAFAYRRRAGELTLAFIPPAAIASAVVTAPEGLEPIASFATYR